MRGIIALILLWVMVPTAVSVASSEDGVKAFQRGDYQTALSELKPAADAGNMQAQFFLALMYYESRGIPKNVPNAFEYFSKAARQGHMDAQGATGMLYFYVQFFLNETK